MNRRSLILHTLVLIGLLFAALALQRSDYERRSAAPGEILIDAKPGQATDVTWRRGDYALKVLSRSDRAGRYYIGEVHAGPAVPPTRFRAGAAAERLFRSLEPLKATRVIDDAGDDKLAEFGLTSAQGATLELMIQGATRSFAIGSGVFGKSDHYARDDQGRVVVLPGSVIGPLDRGRAALLEARLIAAGRRSMTTLSASVDGRELSATQHGTDRPGPAFWARGGEKTGDDELTAWVGQLLTLTAVDWSEDRPRAAALVMTVTIVSTSGSESWRLYRQQSDAGERFSVVSDHGRLTAEVDADAARALVAAAQRVARPTPTPPVAAQTAPTPTPPTPSGSTNAAAVDAVREDTSAADGTTPDTVTAPARVEADSATATGNDATP